MPGVSSVEQHCPFKLRQISQPWEFIAVCPYIPNRNKKSMHRSNYVCCYGADSVFSKTAKCQIKKNKLRVTKDIKCPIEETH